MSSTTSRKPNPNERIDELITQFAKAQRLTDPAQLVREVKVPADIHAAMITGRPELMRLMATRDLTGADAREMFNLVAVLIETNMALAQHVREIGHLVNNWGMIFKGLATSGERICRLANFDGTVADDDEELTGVG